MSSIPVKSSTYDDARDTCLRVRFVASVKGSLFRGDGERMFAAEIRSDEKQSHHCHHVAISVRQVWRIEYTNIVDELYEIIAG